MCENKNHGTKLQGYFKDKSLVRLAMSTLHTECVHLMCIDYAWVTSTKLYPSMHQIQCALRGGLN